MSGQYFASPEGKDAIADFLNFTTATMVDYFGHYLKEKPLELKPLMSDAMEIFRFEK